MKIFKMSAKLFTFDKYKMSKLYLKLRVVDCQGETPCRRCIYDNNCGKFIIRSIVLL